MEENILLMPFLDGSESFVHGFECGKIWAEVEAGEIIESLPIHNENVKQIQMIMETFKCEYTIEPAGNGWSYLKMQSCLNNITK